MLELLTQLPELALGAEPTVQEGPAERLRVAADRPLAHRTDAAWPHVPLTLRRAAV